MLFSVWYLVLLCVFRSKRCLFWRPISSMNAVSHQLMCGQNHWCFIGFAVLLPVSAARWIYYISSLVADAWETSQCKTLPHCYVATANVEGKCCIMILYWRISHPVITHVCYLFMSLKMLRSEACNIPARCLSVACDQCKHLTRCSERWWCVIDLQRCPYVTERKRCPCDVTLVCPAGGPWVIVWACRYWSFVLLAAIALQRLLVGQLLQLSSPHWF